MKRFKTINIPLSRTQRLKVWWWRVWSAVTDPVPDCQSALVEVKPVEEGYDQTWLVQATVPGMKFTLNTETNKYEPQS